MKKKTQALVLAVVVIALATTAAFADAQTISGAISKVTVYRGQALVTRKLNVDLPVGTSELIVTDLPAKIVPESLYAQTSGDIKVLSVRFREKAVREDTREEVKKLDAQIEDVKHQLKYADGEHKHFKLQWEMFAKLKDFTIAAAKSDLNRGLLTFEPIESLTSLIEEKGLEYHKHNMELEDKIAQLKKELELLDRKRKQLDAGRSRTEREAVLFVSNENKKKAVIELSYLVNGANWNPQYNLRANPKQSNVLIEYNAVVNQTSGEHWGGVALSLSTAEPTMVSAPPVLEPMLVSLSRPVQTQVAEQQRFMQIENVRQQLKSRIDNIKRGIAANEELNRLAVRNQTFFFNVDQRQVQEFQQKMAEISRTEGVSVTYDLPGRLSLPSRSDQQLVTIASVLAKADFTLALSNYKNTGVELQLLDRLPYTEDTSVKIELVKTEPELSKDSEYLRTARKKGILRWDLNVPPNTIDEDATVVKYSFTMEYDKNMQIQPRRK